MKVPQNALAQIARDEMHLQFNLLPSVNLHSLKKDLSKIWSNAFTGINDPTINSKHKRAGDAANIIIGFRPELWRDLFKMPIPSNLQGFTKDLVGLNNHSVPATQCDIWLWITHISPATLYDTVFNIRALLQPFTTLVSEQTCFPYYNNVTFDGFADGVANPNSFKAPGTVIIDEGQVGEGGITALVQKWSMDVDRLRGLSVHEGERVYGRRKVSSEELDPQPVDSHVARNQFKRDGVEVDQVLRGLFYSQYQRFGARGDRAGGGGLS
jgi:putative iron-dependent peroxidase